MMKNIKNSLSDLGISSRIFDTACAYVQSIITPSAKGTQLIASILSGKDPSLFSKFLSSHLETSKIAIGRKAKKVLKKLLLRRRALFSDAPYTIAIVIDATNHERSSSKVENSQKFGPAAKWIEGHQWTNIGIQINNLFIPLPPIAFYTKEECKRRGIEYQTANDKIIQFVNFFNFEELFGKGVDKSEIVVLTDSGYDVKKFQNAVLRRGLNFITALKKDRSILIDESSKKFLRIDKVFQDGRRKIPKKSVRIKCGYKKRKYSIYRVKDLVAELKGVRRKIRLISSTGKYSHKFFACSDLNISSKSILSLYKFRWRIESFHKEIKSFLGLQDSSAHAFDSIHSHVNWIFVSYLILVEMDLDNPLEISRRQRYFFYEFEKNKMKKLKQMATQINGNKKIIIHYSSAIDDLNRFKAA